MLSSLGGNVEKSAVDRTAMLSAPRSRCSLIRRSLVRLVPNVTSEIGAVRTGRSSTIIAADNPFDGPDLVPTTNPATMQSATTIVA